MGAIQALFLIVVAVGLGLYGLLLAAIVVTSLIEKRPARYLVPAPDDDVERTKLPPGTMAATRVANEPLNPYASPRTDYAAVQNRAAGSLGFACHGLFAHIKGGTYKVHVALWTSPTREVLAVVGWGTIAGVPADKTLLYSRLDDGRFLLTADKPPGNDTPGLYDIELAPSANFDDLVTRHEGRFARCERRVVPFEGDDVLAAYEAVLLRRHAFLVEQGDAVYVEGEPDTIRSTWKGALKNVARAVRPPDYVRRAAGATSRSANARSPAYGLLSKAEWLFGFLLIFGAFLSRRQPAANQAQWLFRAGLVGLGVVGLLVVYILKFTLRKKSA